MVYTGKKVNEGRERRMKRGEKEEGEEGRGGEERGKLRYQVGPTALQRTPLVWS